MIYTIMSRRTSHTTSHMRHDRLAKLAAFEQLGAGHKAVEVVRDGSGCRQHSNNGKEREVQGSGRTSNGAVHALDHEVCSLVPPQMAQHHLAGENDGTRVDLSTVSEVTSRDLRRLQRHPPRPPCLNSHISARCRASPRR